MSTEFVKAEAWDLSLEWDPSPVSEHSFGIFSFVPAVILPVSAEFAKYDAGDPSPETDSSPETDGDPSLW